MKTTSFWWKIRERSFKIPVAFGAVFPLKKAEFDGVEVFVPNNTEKYNAIMGRISTGQEPVLLIRMDLRSAISAARASKSL